MRNSPLHTYLAGGEALGGRQLGWAKAPGAAAFLGPRASRPQVGQAGICGRDGRGPGACALQRADGAHSSLTILFLWLAVGFGAGCAKIGDPRPPEVKIPKAAVDLAARQTADFIVLTVSKPNENTNGSKATTFQRVDVLRLAEEASGTQPEKELAQDLFMKSATRVLSIRASHFSEYLKDTIFVFQDKPVPESSEIYSRSFRYAVLFVNNKRQSAGLSNQVLITPVPIPLPPTGLSAVISQDSIKLQWSAPSENMEGSKPPRIAGYNIYRSEESQKAPPTPLNRDPLQMPEFEDNDFRFDTTYRYVVSTVGNLKNPYAESLPSDALAVVARDVFPPQPPKDFNAILQGDTIFLLWAPSSSSDLAGYRIYRQEKGTAARLLLQPDLIDNLSCRDNGIEPSKEYEYEIRAVDTHGNESSPVTAVVQKR
jgi:hypothetical protein